MQAIFYWKETRRKYSRWCVSPHVCWLLGRVQRLCVTRSCLPRLRRKTSCSPLPNTLPCTSLPGQMYSGPPNCLVLKIFGVYIQKRDLSPHYRIKQRLHTRITLRNCARFALPCHSCAVHWRTLPRIQFVTTMM